MIARDRVPGGGDVPRPTLVLVHGGPTSARNLTWDAPAQYFATRGWHYLFVNHRGGTGFGRAYQEMLNGQWGVVDVQDARAAALLGAVDRALKLWRDPVQWKQIMLAGMRRDFSWGHSAAEYLRLYRQTLRNKHGS